MEKIKAVLPHREPFLFVDKIIYQEDAFIICEKTFDDDFVYAQKFYPAIKNIPSLILLEALIQSGGVNCKNDDIFTLALLKEVKIYKTVFLPIVVNMKVTTHKCDKFSLLQSGSLYADEKIIIKAKWLCRCMKR